MDPKTPRAGDVVAMDRATFEREFRSCIHEYLGHDVPPEQSRSILRRSEVLTARFAAVVGAQEANRTCARVLEHTAAIMLRFPRTAS